MIGDMISNAIKSNKQVNYKQKTKESDFRRRTEYQIQLSVGIAIHQSTRSKKVIDIMHVLGLSVDYNRILRLKTQLAGRFWSELLRMGCIFLHFCKEIPLLAIDNSDLNDDTPYGKQTTHATATAVYQRVDNDFESATIVPIKTSNRSLQEFLKPISYHVIYLIFNKV